MLNVKDLALLDPEDKIPLNTICQFYHHPVRFVMRDTPLWTMLEEFKKGHYHLAIVQHIRTEGEGDPVYEAVGLITLEDIIEEIIQSEIRDEFDVIRDSRLKRLKRQRQNLKIFLALCAGKIGDNGRNKNRSCILQCTILLCQKDMNPNGIYEEDFCENIRNITKTLYALNFRFEIENHSKTPQLTLAAYQYLSTTLDAFRQEFISENVLQRLIRQNVLKKAVHESSQDTSSATGACLYTKNRECNYFLLVLEGKCSITVGESDLLFEAGPFCYFGYELLQKIMDDIHKRRTSLVGPSSITALAPAAPLGISGSPGSGAVVSSTSQSQVATTTQQSQSCQPISPLAKTTATTATSSPVDISGRKFTFTPDFTLKCDRQDLVYLKISASVYTKAYRATLIERGRSLMLNNTGRASGGGTAGPGIDSMTPLSSPGNDDHSQRHVTGSQSAENVSVAGG
uniref:CBS domain-containing protein n=1 Tax=Romanomermis culicivorax TaxID=13658 RepID=A0A915K5L3_ROMCU